MVEAQMQKDDETTAYQCLQAIVAASVALTWRMERKCSAGLP